MIATAAFWYLIAHDRVSVDLRSTRLSAVLGLASLIIAAPVIATHVMLAALLPVSGIVGGAMQSRLWCGASVFAFGVDVRSSRS